MSFYDAIRVGASGAGDYEVERSFRFNSASSTHLERTPSSAGNRKVWTWSAWVKRANLGLNTATLFHAYDGSSSNRGMFNFQSDDTLNIDQGGGGGSKGQAESTMVFRDVSAWYHIVIRANYSDSTASDRIKLYVNGTQQTLTFDVAYTDEDGQINGTFAHQIGEHGSSNYFDGYMAEINFIDGQAYDASYFGETNATTGQWNPIKYTGSYGTNGFYLDFSDNSSITNMCLDKSGNGNNFSPDNCNTEDSMLDTPTNNFPNWNPLSTNALPTLSEGNLKNLGDNNKACNSNFGVTSGKWYWEVHVLTDVSSTAHIVASGVTGYEMVNDGDVTPRLNYDTSKYSYYKVTSSGGYTQYKRYTDTSLTEIGSGGTFQGNTVLGFRLDMDNGSLKFYTNNTLVHTDTTIPTDGTVIFPMQNATNSGISRHNASIVNFGQDGTFAGNKTAQGNTDSGGIGNFFYAVPSGFKALCSANLPDPTILLPNKHFDTLLYSGNSSTNQITGLNYQPDWVWIKRRNGTNSHQLYDAVRGAGKNIRSDLTNTEVDNTAFNSFDSNGFELDGSSNAHNASGNTYVAWNWDAGETDSATYTVKVVSDSGNKYRFNNFGTSAVTLDLAEGGTYTFDGSDSSMSGHPFVIGTAANGSVYSTGVTYQLDGASVSYSAYTSGYASASTRKLIITVPASAPVLYYWCSIHSGMGGQINTNSTLGSSNFDGSIQTTAKVNASAGFSIVTWSISSNAVYTIGHNLGVAPKAIFMKARNQTTNWDVFHAEVGNTKRIKLNSEAAPQDYTGPWNDTDPTSTVFTSTGSWLNGSGTNVVAYVFSEVAGYSKFGKYTGNGSTNGPFVFTSFRPAFIIIRRSDSTGNWIIMDNKRNTFNYVNHRLRAESNGGDSSSYNVVSFFSNGFKLENQYDGSWNSNGGTFIYFAFAESPFKNSRAR